MKLLLSVPCEYVRLSESSFTYRCEDRVVEVKRLIRRSTGRRNAFYYDADFEKPSDLPPELNRLAFYGGMMRCNVNRRKNPTFDPKKLDFAGSVCVLN